MFVQLHTLTVTEELSTLCTLWKQMYLCGCCHLSRPIAGRQAQNETFKTSGHAPDHALQNVDLEFKIKDHRLNVCAQLLTMGSCIALKWCGESHW